MVGYQGKESPLAVMTVPTQWLPVPAATATAAQAQALPVSRLSTISKTPPSAARVIVLQNPTSSVPVRITESPTDVVAVSIQIVVAILSSAVAASLIIWQMKRQRDLANRQHHDTVKANLQLDAYRDFQRVLSAYRSSTSPSVEIRLIRSAFEMANSNSKDNMPQFPISKRAETFFAQLDAFQSTVVGLVFFLEQYESLLPGFDILKTALMCGSHDVRRNIPAFAKTLARWLPIDGIDPIHVSGEGKFLQCPIISDATLIEFDQTAPPLQKAVEQIGYWVGDLATEIQNFLLKGYADTIVAKREPMDQNFFTVTVDPIDRQRLLDVFSKTDYARSNADAMSWARQAFKLKDDAG